MVKEIYGSSTMGARILPIDQQSLKEVSPSLRGGARCEQRGENFPALSLSILFYPNHYPTRKV